MLRLFIAADNVRAAATDSARTNSRRTESGVTAIEYGLIAGAIAVAIIATVISLGGNIKNLFATTGSALTSAGAGAL